MWAWANGPTQARPCPNNSHVLPSSWWLKFRWFDIRSKISFSYKISNVVLIIVPAFHDCTVTRCGQISLYHFIRKFLMSFVVCYSKQISVTPLDMQLRMHPEIQVSASDWLTSILKGDEEDWKPDLVVSFNTKLTISIGSLFDASFFLFFFLFYSPWKCFSSLI